MISAIDFLRFCVVQRLCFFCYQAFLCWAMSLVTGINKFASRPPSLLKPFSFLNPLGSRKTDWVFKAHDIFLSFTALGAMKNVWVHDFSGEAVDCHQVFIAWWSIQAMIHLLILAGWYRLMVYCFRTLLGSFFVPQMIFFYIENSWDKPPSVLADFNDLLWCRSCWLVSYPVLRQQPWWWMVKGWWWSIFSWTSGKVHGSSMFIYLKFMDQCVQPVKNSLYSNFHRKCLQIKLLVFTSLCYVASLDHAKHNLGAIFVQDCTRVQKDAENSE